MTRETDLWWTPQAPQQEDEDLPAHPRLAAAAYAASSLESGFFDLLLEKPGRLFALTLISVAVTLAGALVFQTAVSHPLYAVGLSLTFILIAGLFTLQRVLATPDA